MRAYQEVREEKKEGEKDIIVELSEHDDETEFA